MTEAQNLGINLDGNSIEILKKVDAIFRDSLINVGLRMAAKTELYKTILGKDSNDLNAIDMVSLDNLDDSNDTSVKKDIKEIKKPNTSWDAL